MTLEHCHKIILLYRLRGRARDMMQAQQMAGNRFFTIISHKGHKFIFAEELQDLLTILFAIEF